MKNIKTDHEKWLYILPFAISWLLLIQLSDTITIISISTLRKIPNAVMFASIFYYLFSKYLWKWSIFQRWLVPYPDLEGTWIGFLQSTSINPKTGKAVTRVPVQFSIKQDFSNLHVTMFTKESESYSQATSFATESDGSVRLRYIYTNKPKATVRGRSEIHEGATSLKLINTSQLALSGDYWTGRKSTGELKIEKKLDKLTNCFTEDLFD